MSISGWGFFWSDKSHLECFISCSKLSQSIHQIKKAPEHFSCFKSEWLHMDRCMDFLSGNLHVCQSRLVLSFLGWSRSQHQKQAVLCLPQAQQRLREEDGEEGLWGSQSRPDHFTEQQSAWCKCQNLYLSICANSCKVYTSINLADAVINLSEV